MSSESPSSQWIEKCVILVSLLLAFPLFFLDKTLFGPRRFAWLIAMCTGLTTLMFLDPTDPTAQFLDKVTMAAVSVVSVPHFMQLIKESPWFGYATIPPIFLVVHLSVTTTVNDSESFWKLRAYLHMAVFILPYLNHLPAGEPAKQEETEETSNGVETKDESAPKATTTTSTAKSGKTAKHKNNKKKN